MIEGIDPKAFIDTVRKMAYDQTENLYSRTFQIGVVDTIESDNVANVLVNGHTTPANNLLCAASYTPRSGNKVLLVSAGRSGADLLILGPVGPPIGQWQTPSLINNWINYGGGFSNAAYSMDSQGFVHMKGTIRRTVDGTAVAFTLPTGYRPIFNQTLLSFREGSDEGAAFYGDPIALRVYTNGNVEPDIGTWINENIRRVGLGRVHFRAGGS